MFLKKIVIAEDDDAIAHMVNMALGDGGYLCLRASDGEEALNVVRMHTPDLLILDVMLPRLDGLEVARRLKSDVLLSKIPILMLTALASVENRVEGLEAGGDDYLVKPFDLRELTARVRALIRTAKREGDRNPTTSLPGTSSVDQQIGETLKGDAACVLHFDIADFDNFADAIGYASAEAFVAKLGSLVLQSSRARPVGAEFVGHLGGADFIAITKADQGAAFAAAVVEKFDGAKESWSKDAEAIAKLSLCVAVVPTDGLDADATPEVSSRLASAMRSAKKNSTSNYVVWSE